MGLFDYIECEMPLDAPDGVEFQTKDTPSQYMEKYKIDKDGFIWHEYREYKIEIDPTKEGIEALFGCLKTIVREWRKLAGYRGSIDFYTDINGEWHEYSALIDDGKVLNIKRVKE